MADAMDAETLKRELASVRKRLEEEVAYHKAQAEAARQRAEAEHLRAQAAEVARRRRLEDQVAELEAQLQEARDHAGRLQRRYEELSEQFLRQERSARDSAQEELARYRAAAQSAWRSAEEELTAMEAELARAREQLEAERARSRQLLDTLRRLQGLEGSGSEDRIEALLAEVAALKKALNLSERARAQAQRRAVRLAEQLVGLEASLHGEVAPGARLSGGGEADRAQPVQRGPALGTTAYPHEVDLSEANAVLQRAAGAGPAQGTAGGTAGTVELSMDLADEFLLVSSDESLDRAKLARLQAEVERAEREDRRHEAAREERRRRNVFLDEPAVLAANRAATPIRPQMVKGGAEPQAVSPTAAPAKGRLIGLISVLVLLGVLIGLAVWLFGV